MYYDIDSALFWYRAIFMTELFISEMLFTWKLSKRPFFAARVAASYIVCLGAAMAFPILSYGAVYAAALFFVLFAISVIMLRYVCYNERWQTIMFYGAAAFAVQHIAYELFNLLVIAFDLNDGMPIEVYGDRFADTYNTLIALTEFVCYFVVYWLGYLFIGRNVYAGAVDGFSFPMLALTMCTIVVSVCFNAAVTYYSYTHPDRFYTGLFSFIVMACCLLALYAQFGLLHRGKMQRELDYVKTMWLHEKKQYRMLKENIDYINVKCHDLRHQISDIGKLRSLDTKSISEIQKIISIYDSSLKTGNEALDILLMEKTMLCHYHGIRITCIADGEALSFMDEPDIYSLFGNALDNAIDALKPVEDEQKRVIGVDIRRTSGFLSVHIYNYCREKPVFFRGLPQTSHRDKYNHGFGMKSMQLIAEKYGGVFRAYLEGDIFNVKIIFRSAAGGGKGGRIETGKDR